MPPVIAMPRIHQLARLLLLLIAVTLDAHEQCDETGAEQCDAAQQRAYTHGPMAMPMNQGKQGTCVGYAFSNTLAHNLLGKYAVPISPEKLVEKVKTLCPCWDGHNIDKMCDEWNAKHTDTGARLENQDQDGKLYVVKVQYTRIDNIEEAYDLLRRTQGVLHMMAVISTQEDGHGLHAVMLSMPFRKRPEMQAINSWGAVQALIEVNRANFKYAVTVDPEIKTVRNGAIPALTRGYRESKWAPAPVVPGIPPPDTPVVAIAANIELVRSGTDGQKEQAAGALANLALNTDNQAAIARAGGIEPLVALVRSGTDGQKEQAAGALWSLAWNTDNKAAIATAGCSCSWFGIGSYYC